jgi:hypothetical protein
VRLSLLPMARSKATCSFTSEAVKTRSCASKVSSDGSTLSDLPCLVPRRRLAPTISYVLVADHIRAFARISSGRMAGRVVLVSLCKCGSTNFASDGWNVTADGTDASWMFSDLPATPDEGGPSESVAALIPCSSKDLSCGHAYTNVLRSMIGVALNQKDWNVVRSKFQTTCERIEPSDSGENTEWVIVTEDILLRIRRTWSWFRKNHDVMSMTYLFSAVEGGTYTVPALVSLYVGTWVTIETTIRVFDETLHSTFTDIIKSIGAARRSLRR